MTDPFDLPGRVAVGAGRLTLDVLIREGEAPRAQAGGTCGNVLTNLAALGWASFPLTDIGDDDPGCRYRADLARCGVRLDLVAIDAAQETPVIVHHVRDGAHSFSSECPRCGYALRYFEPVALPRVQDRLPLVPRADVFFFDRDSPGSLLLARHCREHGARIVYEPNYAGPEVQLDEALAVADVLKFSRDRLGGLAERRDTTLPRLVVETLGGDGLRFREGGGAWTHLAAIPIPIVRDSGGAGDWCTAGLLHLLGRAPTADALRFGKALGAWNCAFEGARGGTYQVGPDRWRADVRRLLKGERFDPAEHAGPSTLDEAGAFCPRCRLSPSSSLRPSS